MVEQPYSMTIITVTIHASQDRIQRRNRTANPQRNGTNREAGRGGNANGGTNTTPKKSCSWCLMCNYECLCANVQ